MGPASTGADLRKAMPNNQGKVGSGFLAIGIARSADDIRNGRFILFLGFEKHVVLFAFDLNLFAEIDVLDRRGIVVGGRLGLLETDQFNVRDSFHHRLRHRTGLGAAGAPPSPFDGSRASAMNVCPHFGQTIGFFIRS